MRKEIKYIGFYDLVDGYFDRAANLAAVNKMNYICDAINRAGYHVKIVSCSWFGKQSHISYEKQHTVRINKQTQVLFCSTWVTNNKILTFIKILWSLIWLFIYLLIKTKKNENVLVYHCPWLSLPIRLAKLFRRFNLVLEVEEVYSDVMVSRKIFKPWEMKLLNCADKYLLSTDMLKERLNIQKPFEVIYGEYKVKKRLAWPRQDGFVHLVYAGVIDSHKAGAFNALEATRFLSKKYWLHIIGFGEIEKLKKCIGELEKINDCKVSYDGLLKGDDYIKFCQSCHIGLSTQINEGKYLESSFPSKVLSYLAMGLRVVSGPLLCVKKSSIGKVINYYEEALPESIAKAIISIDLTSSYNSLKKIKDLDASFVLKIKRLLEL